MPVMYYDDRIPSVNIRGKLFFWDYISVLNSNLCTHCILTKPFYLYTWAAHTVIVSCMNCLMIRCSFGCSGDVVFRRVCGWERMHLNWRMQFCTSPSMFPSNRRTVASLQPWFLLCLLKRTAGLTGNSQEPNMPEIGTSQEFLEYRHPVSVPSHCSFQASKPPRIQFDPQS